MRHAVLGAGGIGGLIAGALARSNADVHLLLRPEASARYCGNLRVESAVLGDFAVEVAAANNLEDKVDVLWVATKATQLLQALALAPPEHVRQATVVPLLNGIDHVELLRRRYRNVVAAAIRVESERTSDGIIRQKSPFLRVDIAGAESAQAALRVSGIDCRSRADEITLLWEKLVFLAPIALATAAFDAPLGAVRGDPAFSGCREEAAVAARTAGADIDLTEIQSLHDGAPDQMQSSMQKDVSARREPELDAIAGPIQRLARRHSFRTPSTDELSARVLARLG